MEDTKISITAGKLLDIGAWDEVCGAKGLNPWCMNEGLISSSEKIHFSNDELKQCPAVRGYLRRLCADE